MHADGSVVNGNTSAVQVQAEAVSQLLLLTIPRHNREPLALLMGPPPLRRHPHLMRGLGGRRTGSSSYLLECWYEPTIKIENYMFLFKICTAVRYIWPEREL